MGTISPERNNQEGSPDEYYDLTLEIAYHHFYHILLQQVHIMKYREAEVMWATLEI